MRAELERKIREAQGRLGVRARSEEELVQGKQSEAIERFRIYLAEKIDLWLRAELLLEAEYLWDGKGPAVKFRLEGHAFRLTRGAGETVLWEETQSGRREIASLTDEDRQFADRLLVALGEVLEPPVAAAVAH